MHQTMVLLTKTDIVLNSMKNILVAGALGAIIGPAQASAADFECSADSLMKHVGEQTQQIEAYIASSDDPQQTQQELASMARGLRENGRVSNHDEEMKKLASTKAARAVATVGAGVAVATGAVAVAWGGSEAGGTDDACCSSSPCCCS